MRQHLVGEPDDTEEVGVEQRPGLRDRALFVVDRNGIIFWSYLSPIAVNPGADGILDALESLQNKEK